MVKLLKKLFASLLIIVVFTAWTGHTIAESPITIKVGDQADAAPIPEDFCGLSFEISNVSPDKDGTYQFSAENTELVNLFRTIGIKNLRVGGGTVDLPEYKIPGPADIDKLFAFAKAADCKIIYNLRLLNGDIKANAELAKYIQEHYASQLACFQIGNEPDWHSFHTSPNHPRDPRIVEAVLNNTGSAYPSYLKTWREFATAIDAAAPGAKYTGPDAGSNFPLPGTKDTDYDGKSWTEQFAHDEKSSGRIVYVAQHDYVGEGATGVTVPKAVASMLSKEWVEKRYPALFDHVLGPAQKEGLTYRMLEANDYTGGVDGASNAYVSALWVLDYLHWHAEHHAAGVNFHNKRWIFTDTIYRENGNGAYRFNPKAYGFRAFHIGSEGSVVPVTFDAPKERNLTAYAVRGKDALFVTVLNKEYGADAKDAAITIQAKGISGRPVGMFLKAPNNEPTARIGITLGDAPITTDSWNGKWSDLNHCENGKTTLQLPPTSAVIVKLAIH
jgi:hypothetical protein